MRKLHDQIAKQLLKLMLEGAGKVDVGREVAPEAQEADVLFEPEPQKLLEAHWLGLLGRLAQEACLLEPFRKTPPLDEVLDCVVKLHGARRIQRNEAKRGRHAVLPMRVWVLSPGLPVKTMHALELRHRDRLDTPGLYGSAAGFRLGLVVIDELPVHRETLALRLLGRGATRKRAVGDLVALPASAPEKIPLLELLNRFSMGLEPRTQDNKEFLMITKEAFEEYKTKIRLEGRMEGRMEGRHEGEFKGRQAALLKLVSKRWPGLLAETEALTAHLPSAQALETLFEALLDAASLTQARQALRQTLPSD